MPKIQDRRSNAAEAYRAWYKTGRWQRLRARQLREEPFCRMCAAAGRVTIATVCDHVDPHKGDPDKFWNGPFQSLCDEAPWRCHSSRKQSIEAIGYDNSIGIDGLPTDPAHPFNRGS